MPEVLFVPRPPDSSSPATHRTHVCRTATVLALAVFTDWVAEICLCAFVFSDYGGARGAGLAVEGA